jgi:ribonucleoside-diphosphate reductase alpha chain
VTGHPNIKFATSIVDYIFRVLGVEYLKRYDFAQVKPSELPVSIDDPTGRALIEEPPSARFSEPPLGSEIGDTAFNSEAPGALNAQLEEMMGDAPVCDVCGHITVRNGACYKCLNCGNSLGCS